VFGLRRLLVLGCLVVGTARSMSAQFFDPGLFSGLKWRLVGPFRGGRVLAVTGIPGDPNRFYFGSVGGGVWRTDNAGRTWEPIFDGQPVASIGAIAAAPSNPQILYVGSGEADMRSDISYGNGMYKSTDAGKTWARIGLEDTRQIGRVLVDPRDPDIVFVAALGHGYGPNKERGVFRSKDGGKSWSQVLFKDENTGAIDLAFDPKNPNTILASMWQTRRPPWNVYPPSNGPGSGLYRSTDAGDTWAPMTGNGFPSAVLGHIGIAFAPSDPGRLYAIVDAKEGGLYTSGDGGTTWKRTSADKRIWDRGWYFGKLAVDPKDPDTVYVSNTALYKSTDGGKIFVPIKGAPGGDDYHHLWIDPSEPRRMIVASDQGAVVSVDGARTWSSWYNQPTAQLYHVSTDDRFPYWIYGAQQDSGAVATPSRTDYRGITLRDWRPIAAGGESGMIAPDPSTPDIVFGGTVGRFDQRTLQDQNVDPTLADPGEYRGEWTLPLVFSPRDPKALYFSNQFLFKTTDGGRHWEKVSPDLTREDPGVPPNLDAVSAKNTAVKGPPRGVIYAIAPSPVRDAWLWCGTDDGLIWLTRDDGKNWENVTPRELTLWSKIGILEASHFDAGTAYAAVDRHRLDDIAPHIYRTRDSGKTWTAIVQGMSAGSYVNAVREDPERKGLLYAGTETGVFVSFDDGDRWQPLQANLPNCSIRDISIRRGDLVIATHGRSIWVLDDVSALRQLDAASAADDAWLFAPRDAVRLHPAGFQGTPEPKEEAAGENPPGGAILDYLLKTASASPVTIEILDGNGAVVRTYSSVDPPRPPDLQRIVTTPDWIPATRPPSASAGLHRFNWDLKYTAPKELSTAASRRGASGPWAPPGRYTVRLSAAGKTLERPLVVTRDPRISATDDDLQRQFALTRDVQALRVGVARARLQADSLRKKIAALRGKATGAASSSLDSFARKLGQLAGPPGEPTFDEAEDADEPATSLRRLATILSRFQGVVESADAAPTPDALTGFQKHGDTTAQALARWREFLGSDLARVNEALAAGGLEGF
jgi:photosystem II stability/assembly factor-like uncharacterized protein